jgi:hypothetical protein
MSPSLQSGMIPSQLTLTAQPSHKLRHYLGEYLIEGASDTATMRMVAGTGGLQGFPPFFPLRPAGAFSV